MPTFFSSLSLRHGYLAGFLSCVGLMAAAFYFEYVMYLDPCPLCMLQRVAVVLTGLGFLAAFFAQPSARQKAGPMLRLALIFTLAACVFGLWASGRHIWIQSLPPSEVPACAPSIYYLMETTPALDVLSLMLKGDGNCAEIDWLFLGLSMPQWLCIWFVGFTAATLFALFKTRS
ncbi:MAG: hypothetical protein RL217_1241 [Pseudomonadota bacterium]